MEKIYKPKDFAKLCNVTVKTLQNWDNEGKLIANRTATNRRYYTYEQYLDYIHKDSSKTRINIIYARVSSKQQKADLESQTEFLKTFCNANGMIIDTCISDIGSGLNYNRPKWNKLLDDVMDCKINTIVVAHKDRFIRFGFEWFEQFCNKFGTKILVVNNENLSPQEELVQDIVSILHVFSCRLYGLRKYKSKIQEDSEIVKEL